MSEAIEKLFSIISSMLSGIYVVAVIVNNQSHIPSLDFAKPFSSDYQMIS